MIDYDGPSGLWTESNYRTAIKDLEKTDRATIDRAVKTTKTGQPSKGLDYQDKVKFG